MNILGIDYGDKKIGLALGDTESRLAEPLEVVRKKVKEKQVEQVLQVLQVHQVDKIVVGVSEGKSKEKAIIFGKELEKRLGVKVVYQDETLSTQEAQRLSIEAGMKQKKRRQKEDAFAATLILQSYLDNL